MQVVHGNRQRFVRLLGNGAVRHRTGFKPCHDGIHAFDFIDVDALFRVMKIHQSADIRMLLLLVHQFCVLLEQPVIPAHGGLL